MVCGGSQSLLVTPTLIEREVCLLLIELRSSALTAWQAPNRSSQTWVALACQSFFFWGKTGGGLTVLLLQKTKETRVPRKYREENNNYNYKWTDAIHNRFWLKYDFTLCCHFNSCCRRSWHLSIDGGIFLNIQSFLYFQIFQTISIIISITHCVCICLLILWTALLGQAMFGVTIPIKFQQFLAKHFRRKEMIYHLNSL
jgi:hypothetical protein